jgi:hypothetical protein
MKKFITNMLLAGASLGLTGGGAAIVMDGLESGYSHGSYAEAIDTHNHIEEDVIAIVGGTLLTLAGGAAIIGSGVKIINDYETYVGSPAAEQPNIEA